MISIPVKMSIGRHEFENPEENILRENFESLGDLGWKPNDRLKKTLK